MTTAPTTPTSKASPRSHKLLIWALGIVGFLSIGLFLGFAVTVGVINARYSATLEQTDASQSGWRWSDLQAARAAVPDSENSAKVVQAAAALMPASWPGMSAQPSDPRPAESSGPLGPELFGVLLRLSPDSPLNATQRAELTAELAKLSRAVAEADKLADLPTGRFDELPAPIPLVWAFNGFPNSPALVGRLMLFEGFRRAEAGDADGALAACRAMLNAGRSVGDDPSARAQLFRMMSVQESVPLIERTLAQGEPSDSALAQLQALFEDEAPHPGAEIVIRGLRAAVHDSIQALIDRELTLSQYFAAMGAPGVTPPRLPYLPWYRYNQTRALDLGESALGILRRPTPDQLELWRDWGRSRPSIGPVSTNIADALSRPWMWSCQAAGKPSLLTTARIRVALVLIAAERHRKKHGTWPKTLSAIDRAFLPQPPTDPFTGKPVSLLPGERGGMQVEIARPDHNLFGFGVATPRRLDFRLIDPDRRGRPPTEVRPKPE